MVILGLLIILLAVAAGAAFYLGTAPLTDRLSFDVLGAHITINPLGLAMVGAAILLVFWFGWSVLRIGMRRTARRRKAAKEAERQAEAERAEAERRSQEQLAVREHELEAERAAREQEAEALRQQAEARVKEQHLATETARQRAEVAEGQLRDQGETPPADRRGPHPSG